MKYTALLLICLIGLSIAEQASPADRILQQIDNLVSATRNEQAQQTKIFISQSARCKAEVEFRSHEINDAKVAKGAADQQKQICSAELPVARAAHAQSKTELKQTFSQIDGLKAEFDGFVQINLGLQKEHQQAVAAIQGAYNIIGNFANGKSALNNQGIFVEVAQHLNKIFKLSIKNNFHSAMIPVMSALVQITQKPATTIETSALLKVVSLLKKLEQAIKASENRRVASFAQFKKIHDEKVALLNAQAAALKVILAKYRVYISNLNGCVVTETAVYRLAAAKLDRNSNILVATQDMCASYDAKYKVQTQQRTEYVALLSKLRSFIVTTINEYKGGLYSHGDYQNVFVEKTH